MVYSDNKISGMKKKVRQAIKWHGRPLNVKWISK